MRMMILQYVASLLMLGFGVSSLRVSRRLLYPLPHRLAWTVTGTAFTLAGLTKLAQNVFGTFALVAGPGSPAWKLYLGWAPAFDYSRTGILTTLFLLLFLLLAPHRSYAAASSSGHPGHGRGAFLLTGGILGALAGLTQGWDDVRHFRNVTISDTAVLLLVLGSLFALLLRERVDRLLWVALSLYAVNLAMNVLWLSAWMQTPRMGGTFSPIHLNATRIAILATMVCLALRRLFLAKHGTPVAGLLSSLTRRPVSSRQAV